MRTTPISELRTTRTKRCKIVDFADMVTGRKTRAPGVPEHCYGRLWALVSARYRFVSYAGTAFFSISDSLQYCDSSLLLQLRVDASIYLRNMFWNGSLRCDLGIKTW